MSRQVQLRSSARHVWALEQEAREEKIKHTLEGTTTQSLYAIYK